MESSTLGLIAFGALVILFVVGAIVLASSIQEPSTADTPNRARPFLVEEATKWQKWIFLAYVVVGPLYLLLDWSLYGSTLEAPKLALFQYKQKLISDLWSAGAIMFGLFWGLKK